MTFPVAALYVDPHGPYPGLAAEWFDEARDARAYAGPFPVVAHPPCGPWGRHRAFCTRQDETLGPIAVEQVRRWGGVLEHPADSRLFAACGLPRPGELPDAWGGRTFAVDQVAWGHRARKRTWLYAVRVPARVFLESAPFPDAEPTAWVTKRPGQTVALPLLSSKVRHLTPRPFAEWLLSIASMASPVPGLDGAR